MNLLLTLIGLLGVTRQDNSPAQQSIAPAILGVGLVRSANAAFPQQKEG